MFICGPCAQHYEYNFMRGQSMGACEICGRPRPCDDIPSGSLPKPPEGVERPPWAIKWATKPYIYKTEDIEGCYRVCWQMPGKTPDEITVDRRIRPEEVDDGFPREPGINWSAMGTVSPFTAWAHAEMTELACRVATVGDHQLAELLKQYPIPEHITPDRALNKVERGEMERREDPGIAWVRQTKALTPGDPCEWHYPARREWKKGKVVRNGDSGYWEVEDEDGQRVKGLYVEMIKAQGGAHYEDVRS